MEKHLGGKPSGTWGHAGRIGHGIWSGKWESGEMIGPFPGPPSQRVHMARFCATPEIGHLTRRARRNYCGHWGPTRQDWEGIVGSCEMGATARGKQSGRPPGITTLKCAGAAQIVAPYACLDFPYQRLKRH